MKLESREAVAALLTIAATQNAEPDRAVANDTRLVAEGIVRLYEQIQERLAKGSSYLSEAMSDSR